MTIAQLISPEGLEAMLWQKHLDDHLIVYSFVKSNSLLRYIGVIKGSDKWRPKVLESRESLSKAFTRGKNSKNGSFAIALIRQSPQTEIFSEECLLTEEQAFGPYVQLIEFVDGDPVVYGEKSIDQGNAKS
ncbi:hypothetical protein QMK61_00125 [Fulvimonas sp. R45]|uniref:hypothetical protein n=1 Tax=Fulvimonas sp. R45 TaxID=3045937 RepID=UPI00265DADC4|nr:hypothetical protein [Fulvimonas sp. R45]MDO1527226.1 hypothetical protein [Fulvimonas sp. R45]